MLNKKQQEQFHSGYAGDIFPEYYILRVDDFDSVAKTPLDEWISFLKTGDIPETATAPGLPEARQKLLEDAMTPEERLRYRSHLESLRYQRSVLKTSYVDGVAKGREEGKAEGRTESTVTIARAMKAENMDASIISRMTGFSADEIMRL
jgi:predicted transposase/invertase (TIGR01784 family)